MSIAVHTLRQFGYNPSSSVDYSNIEGESFSLVKQSPALIAKIVSDSTFEYNVKSKALKMDVMEGVVDNDAVLKDGLWLDPAIALVPKTSTLSFQQKRSLTLYMCDSVPIASLIHSWGYDVESVCMLRGRTDAQYHRVFEGPHFQNERC